MRASRLEPFWKTGTGDGFGLAFPDDKLENVLQFAAELFDAVARVEKYKIRLSASHGRVLGYKNVLLEDKFDICGPGIIIARRLLDAANDGFLIEHNLAANLEGIEKGYWSKRLLPSREYHAKHGLLVHARRFVPESESRSYIDAKETDERPEIISIARALGAGPHASIVETAASRSTTWIGVDRLLIRWMDASCRGIPPDVIYVTPQWHPETLNPEGLQRSPLLGLDDEIMSAIRPLLNGAEIAEIARGANKPKVWLRELRLPLTDRPTLEISAGGLDYAITKSLEMAYERNVSFRGAQMSLRKAFEDGLLDINEDMPSMAVPSMALLTNDDCLMFAQRAKKGMDFAPGRFSPSCEEQWNPATEHDPHKTVLRRLSEEWNIDEDHGTEVPESAIRLVALGREWGRYWNTVLIYVVDLPCSSDKVIDCWNLVPKDRAEAVAIGAVPIRLQEHRQVLLDLARSRQVRPQRLTERCGAKWSGNPSDNELHDTTGVARILFAIAHRFGLESLIVEVHAAQGLTRGGTDGPTSSMPY